MARTRSQTASMRAARVAPSPRERPNRPRARIWKGTKMKAWALEVDPRIFGFTLDFYNLTHSFRLCLQRWSNGGRFLPVELQTIIYDNVRDWIHSHLLVGRMWHNLTDSFESPCSEGSPVFRCNQEMYHSAYGNYTYNWFKSAYIVMHGNRGQTSQPGTITRLMTDQRPRVPQTVSEPGVPSSLANH